MAIKIQEMMEIISRARKQADLEATWQRNSSTDLTHYEEQEIYRRILTNLLNERLPSINKS